MNLLPKFKEYLFSPPRVDESSESRRDRKPLSKVTVKNYLSDVSRFVKWFEGKLGKFSPDLVTPQIIEQFRQSSNLTASSLERNLSSLRKFFNFLVLEGVISQSPLKIENLKLKIEDDPYHLKAFKDYLYVYNASKLTIKNYLMDVKGFTKWAEEVTNSKSAWDTKEKDVLGKIDSPLIEEYKRRLLASLPASLSLGGEPWRSGPYAPRTINRKLSSLRKYLSWLKEEGLISNQFSVVGYQNFVRPFSVGQSDKQKTEKPASENRKPRTENREYSSFPPFRLVQKIISGIAFIPEFILVNPLASLTRSAEHLIWKLKGKPVFDTVKSQKSKVKSLPKEVFAPFAISTKYLPVHRKLLFHLAHTRPQWYKRYHQYSFSHYLHLAILMVFMSVIGFGIYQNIYPKSQNQAVLGFANPQIPPRILSFQGRLTDSSDNPITSSTNLRFALYDSLTGTGSALLWQEVNTVTPDSDGIFSLLLGNRSTMSQSLFAERAGLWLGVTVGQTAELTPRQRLATVAYAENADNLQGLPPITQSGAGTNNVVLALDSSGNLTIGGTATPTFQATGGKFTLSGNPLLLTTSAANSNVQINPNGRGFIDLQKPLQNSTNNNNISSALGAVEVDDLVAILATSSGQSALTINQNGAGPILSASSSGTAKFTVGNSGDITTASTLAVNGSSITSTQTTFNLLNSTVTTLNIGGAATTINLGATSGTTTTANSLTILGNTTLGDTAADTIAFTGSINSNVVPDANNTRNLGSSSLRWNTVYGTNGDFTNIAGTVTGGSTTSNSWTINSDNATNNAEIDSLAFGAGTAAFNSVLQWNAVNNTGRVVGFDNTNLFNYPIGIFSQVSGANQTFTSGTLFKYGQPTVHAITQSGAFTGSDIDFSSNITVPNSASGNQTGFKTTLKDGGASATAIGFQTAGTLDYGLDVGGTIGTADIRLSNGETISNTTNGVVSILGADLALSAGQGLDVASAGILGVGNTTATTVNIGNTAATTLTLGSAGALTRTISIGTGTGADTINIGTGTVTADTISIGGLSTTVLATTGTLTHTGTANINTSGSATTAIGNSTGSLTLASGGTSSWTNTSGNLTIQTATSGTLVLDSAAAINIGNTNATSLSIGRTGVTTTNNGSLTSTQTLTASNGLTLTTGALNLTATSGSTSITGYGTTSITSTTASGNILTLADSSFTTTGANLANLTFTNTNAGAGAVTTNGISITPTGTAITGGGSNTLNAINLPNVTAIASNTFNGINFGTGYNNLVNSANWTVTAAGAETIAGNFSQTGATTLSTGTGAISLNGNTTLGSGKTFTWTTGAIDNTGKLGVGTTGPGAQVEVDTGATTTIGQIIKAQASQTADLLQIQNSVAGILAKIDSLGNLTANTLTSTVAQGTAPLTVTSTTVVANLNAAAAQQPMPNLVLNSDFGRRNKWMTFMPETFADTSGYQQIDAGAAPTVAANTLTFGAANNEIAWPKSGVFWKDHRVSLMFKQVNNTTGLYILRGHYIDANNYIRVWTDGVNLNIGRVTGGGSSGAEVSSAYATVVGNYYWIEMETQGVGTSNGRAIGKVYSCGASACAKSSATLGATVVLTTATGSVWDAPARVTFTVDQANVVVGAASPTGDGWVYVEGWGPESWTPVFSGTLGGQAIGFNETADSGPLTEQWTMQGYIPATSRNFYLRYSTPDGAINAATAYTVSGYIKTSGKGGSGPLVSWYSSWQSINGGTEVSQTRMDDSGEVVWTRLTGTKASTESSVRRAGMTVYFNIAATATGTAFFDLPQIEQGSVATPWRNAPADEDPIIGNVARSGTSTSTTSTTFVELDSRDAAINFFMPWDGTMDLSFLFGGYSNSGLFDIYAGFTVDGTVQDNSTYGTFYFTETNVGLPKTTTVRTSATLAAGKHRIAFVWRVNAGSVRVSADIVPARLLVTATRGKFDLAEEYTVSDQSIEAGDVVRLMMNDKGLITNSATVEKTDKGYDGSVLGIVSTAPGITLASSVELNTYRNKPNLRPVALSGRVPVKVTNENGVIRRGDILTSSNTKPGYAMKATKAGKAIGIAMEDLYGSEGKVMTFVNLSFYDPDVYLTDSGQFVINKVVEQPMASLVNDDVSGSTYQVVSGEPTPSPILNTKYIIQNTSGETLSRIGAFKDLFVANLKVGSLDFSEIKGFGKLCVQSQSNADFGLIKNVCSQTTVEKVTDSATYAVKTYLGEVVTGGQILAEAVIGSVKAGIVETQELIAGRIVSPIAEIQTVKTDTITPLSGSDLRIRLGTRDQSKEASSSSKLQALSSKLLIENASGSAVASIDDKGVIRGQSLEVRSASISGTLDAFGLISKEASISGTLRAKNIVADNISSEVAGIKYLVSSIKDQIASPSAHNTYYELQATESAQLAQIDTLQAQVGTFMQGLFAVGPTSLSDATVFGQLSIGGNLILADSSINVLGSDLKLQPLGQGGILLGKKVYINSSGDLTTEGNATVKGTLFAGLISPVPGGDLVFNLGNRGDKGASGSARLLVKNASGSAVLSVNNKGDITSSGSAKFNDLLAKTFSIVRSAQADTSLNETVASSSAGFAVITAGQLERTIITPFVKANSLIYLTPTSDTQGETPYVARQTLEDLTLGTKASFTIGISQPLDKDIKLNWWIVN